MVKRPDVMIDIETLALTPDAVVLSIGAVVFDRTRTLLDDPKFIRKLSAAQQKGRRIDVDTVRWWMKQSPTAQAEAFDGAAGIVETLAELNAYITTFATYDVRVWANSPQFDLVILRHLYAERTSIQPVWGYGQERCVRTYIEELPEATRALAKGEVKHSAVDDCIYQAKLVQMEYLRRYVGRAHAERT